MKIFVHKFFGSAACLFFCAALFVQQPAFASKAKDPFSYFVGMEKFSKFKETSGEQAGEIVLTSPVYEIPIQWNELVPSWNADAPKGTFLKVEVRGIYPDHTTKFYNLGIWSPDDSHIARQSVRGQKDDDGNVSTDTLILNRPGAKAQIRITLGGVEKGKRPKLKFLGLSFCDSKAQPTARASKQTAWGKEVDVIARSQNAYPNEKGWCSPTSVSMVLDHWSKKTKRSDLALDVPELVPVIFDKGWGGTGNWPFNTAFVGTLKGMRAYVTRLSDITELEQWTEAGFPIVISSPWHLLQDGRKNTGSGHIVVVRGFTKEGDVVINDPGTNPKTDGRRIYKRQNVINAWKKSNNTVYLIYPEKVKIPKDLLGHWE
ncbi:MAG: peptidase C39 family protein [Verrucomicrobia bacterium]|nr:peptidase C39 family protein [Verrucomicrobiota bacterium]